MNDALPDDSDEFYDEEADDMDQRIAAILDANNNIQACCVLEYTDTQGN